MTYINISGYQFINLYNLEELQNSLKSFCVSLGLKGTILLGKEGINSFLSGSREQIDTYCSRLPEFGFSIEYKESPSTDSPFNKMLVKIKPEIVTMGRPEVDPIKYTAPRVSAQTFKQWLDEEKPMIVLDTRNEYEVRIGKFKNAIDLTIRHFREFPDAVSKLPEEYKSLPIVTYCTGGIRCEKAAPFMMMQGYHDVYQLDGGILKYLEECGNTHYEGECFVFDKRIAVDDALEETPTLQCIVCRNPVTADEQRSGYYSEGKSCPHCFSTIRESI
jgi:UPF0176 protein